MKTTFRRRPAAGFTLIEIMVSVSIFAIVLVVSMGAVLSILDANRKAQAVSSVMDNLNSTLEGMTRTIKTNTNYIVSDSGRSIRVTDDDSSATPKPTMEYYFDEVGDEGRIMFTSDGGSEGTSIQVTAPEVDIDEFAVTALEPLDSPGQCRQPKVLLTITGTAGVNERVRTRFAIQTIVSQRDLNIRAECF